MISNWVTRSLEAAASRQLSPPQAEPEPRRHVRQKIQAPAMMIRKPATKMTSGIKVVRSPKRMPITQTAIQAREKTQQVGQSEPCRGSSQPFGGYGQLVNHGVRRARVSAPGRPAVGSATHRRQFAPNSDD